MEGIPYLIAALVGLAVFFVVLFYVIKGAVKRAIFEARQVIDDDTGRLL